MRRQFLNSEEFPRTHPSPVMTLSRMKAPGRIWVRAPIQAGPMIVAWAGRLTPAPKWTGPSMWTPGGTAGACCLKPEGGKGGTDLLKPLPWSHVGPKEGAEGGERLGEGKVVGCLQGIRERAQKNRRLTAAF